MRGKKKDKKTEKGPDEFTTTARYLNFPPIPEVPEHLRGRSFIVIDASHLGAPAEADRLLAPCGRWPRSPTPSTGGDLRRVVGGSITACSCTGYRGRAASVRLSSERVRTPSLR